MRELKIDEDAFVGVIEGIQTEVIQKGVQPENCGESISQLFKISENEAVRPEEVPNYIRQKIVEKEKIETEISSLKEQMQYLKAQKEALLQQNNVTTDDVNSYVHLRDQLRIYDIPPHE